MARYDYRCTACNKVFEVEHGMREHPEVTCPDRGAAATRLLSASGIVLKGSGFYNTDQRGKKGCTEATSGPAESCASSDKPAGDSCAGCPKSEGAAASATSAPAKDAGKSA